MSYVVRPVRATDAAAWLAMRVAFWPDGSEEEHRAEIDRFFKGLAGEPLAVLVAEDPTSRLVGLAELSVRPCAEGCRTDRVAYLEGWYVVPEARGLGVGRALVEAAFAWGRKQGCSELASDTRVDNEDSRRAHEAMGFEDVGAVRCFRIDL